MGNWTEWANDVVWDDTITFVCECGFDDEVNVQCEGNGTRWTAYVECPGCGVDGYTGGN